MKTLVTVSATLLVLSCGRVDPAKNNILGSVMSFEPAPIGSEDARIIRKICESLKTKESNLSASSSTIFTFGIQDKSCTGSLSAESSVAVTVDTVGAPKFKRVDNGGSFIFPDVETTDSGIMKDICANTANPVSPIKNSTGVALWFSSTDSQDPDCNSSAAQPCLVIKKGIPSGDKFEIIGQETLQFQTVSNLGNVGYFLFRKSITNTSCINNDYTEIRATLK
jgi:hypothetical protein